MWAHNGQELFYIETVDLWYLTVATVRTEPNFAVVSRERLGPFDSYAASTLDHHWDVSPDDQRVLAIR